MNRIQCIFLGSSFVGKSSLILHARHGKFKEPHPTLGVENICYVNNDICLTCWDTSGNPRFKRVSSLFINSAQVIVYVFDQTNRDSLQECIDWHCESKGQARGSKIYFLIGNKSDLVPALDLNLSTVLDTYPELRYVATDARSEQDVKGLFASIIETSKTIPLEIESQPDNQKECCCIV